MFGRMTSTSILLSPVCRAIQYNGRAGWGGCGHAAQANVIMSSPLRPLLTQLGGSIPLALHEHVALFQRSPADTEWLSAFLAEGIERGDFCLVVARRSFSGRLLAELRAQAVEVDSYIRSGGLRLHDGTELAQLGEWTEQAFQDAESARAPALRWVEDAAWPLEPACAGRAGFGLDEFFEGHALLNYRVKQYPSVALCCYDLDAIDPPQLFRALAVHRHLIVEKTLVRDNPFYVPPEKFIPMSPQERERDLLELFRELGFDREKLLAAIRAFGRIQP